MKKLLLALLMMTVGCSAPSENIDEAQEAVGTCPRPTGGGGYTTAPPAGYVSAIYVDPTASWRIKVQVRSSAGVLRTYTIDMGGTAPGSANALITGPGWTSVNGSRITEVWQLTSTFSAAQQAGCPNDPNLICMFAYESPFGNPFPVLYFDKAYSWPSSTHFFAADGLSGWTTGGSTTPQTWKMWGTSGGYPSNRTTDIIGPAMDACLY